MAAIRETTEMCPNTLLQRRASAASSTMMRVAAPIRMVSGRKRRSSTPLGIRLPGTGNLLGRVRGAHLERHVDLRLVEHAGRRAAHRRQEGLGVDAHPDHHGDQRNDGRPFARTEIEYVLPHVVRRVAVEYPLIQPEHVAGRENYADGGEDGPVEI